MVRDSDTRRRRGDRSTARRRLEGMFSENFEASPSRGNPGGYPGPMAPHENALSMDSAEQRIVAFTAGSHGLVHTYELDPDSVDRVGRGVLDDGRGSRTRRDCRLRTVRRRRTSGRHPRRPIRVQAAHSRLSRRNGGIVSPREPRAQPPHARARDRRVGVTASVYHPAGLSLLSKSVDQRGTALGYHGIGEPRDRARPAGDRAPPLSLRLADRHGRAHGTRGRGRRLRSHRRYRRRAS